ncbi:MAG: GerMN domain-containing protein [Acidobacteriota bacterium]|nr:GerMN domain-containing protein [Acidobacteriota bacterium]
MRRAVAVAFSSALWMLSGCAIPNDRSPVALNQTVASTSTSTTLGRPGSDSSRLTIYLIGPDGLLVARLRPDPSTTVATAVQDLLAGPTDTETADGLTSALPSGTRLEHARVTGSTAVLDFNESLASSSGKEQLLAFAQIVLTAVAVKGITHIEISVAGQTVNAPEPNGTLAEGPVNGLVYAGLLEG